MSCRAYEALRRKWTWQVHHPVVGHVDNGDNPTVDLFWKMTEHRTDCEVCRDEDIGLGVVPVTERQMYLSPGRVLEVGLMANVAPPFFCPKCGNEIGYTYDASTGRHTPQECIKPGCPKDSSWR